MLWTISSLKEATPYRSPPCTPTHSSILLCVTIVYSTVLEFWHDMALVWVHNFFIQLLITFLATAYMSLIQIQTDSWFLTLLLNATFLSLLWLLDFFCLILPGWVSRAVLWIVVYCILLDIVVHKNLYFMLKSRDLLIKFLPSFNHDSPSV